MKNKMLFWFSWVMPTFAVIGMEIKPEYTDSCIVGWFIGFGVALILYRLEPEND